MSGPTAQEERWFCATAAELRSTKEAHRKQGRLARLSRESAAGNREALVGHPQLRGAPQERYHCSQTGVEVDRSGCVSRCLVAQSSGVSRPSRAASGALQHPSVTRCRTARDLDESAAALSRSPSMPVKKVWERSTACQPNIPRVDAIRGWSLGGGAWQELGLTLRFRSRTWCSERSRRSLAAVSVRSRCSSSICCGARVR